MSDANEGDGQQQASSASTSQTGIGNPPVNPPLLIVSESNRRSDEARRTVRAQAARASAAQSRATRARRREERQGRASGSDLPPAPTTQRELVPTLEHLPAVGTVGEDDSQPPHAQDEWWRRSLDPSTASSSGRSLSVAGDAAFGRRRQLPPAVPAGFRDATLPESLVGLVSQVSCFDLSSPGVEERLYMLLADLNRTRSPRGSSRWDGPLPALARIACMAVTLYQAQGSVSDFRRYHDALEAVWAEATGVDQSAVAVTHPAADAMLALWALTMVCVTCNPSATTFDGLIDHLLGELQVGQWAGVRQILVNFLYPAFYLDQNDTCARFFLRFRRLGGDGAG